MTVLSFRLRAAEAADAEILSRLHEAAFSRPWTAGEFASLLSGGARGVIAETGAEAACFLLYRFAAGEGEILTLATHPAFCRLGAARTCLAWMRARGAEEGVTALFLEVAEDNAAAISLYRREGFTQAGMRKAYYAGGINALVMRLQLD